MLPHAVVSTICSGRAVERLCWRSSGPRERGEGTMADLPAVVDARWLTCND